MSAFFSAPKLQTPPGSLHFSAVCCLIFAQCWVCYHLYLNPFKKERKRKGRRGKERRGDGGAASMVFLIEKNHEFVLTLITITVEIMTKEDADKMPGFLQRILEASIRVMEKKAGQYSAKGKNRPDRI